MGGKWEWEKQRREKKKRRKKRGKQTKTLPTRQDRVWQSRGCAIMKARDGEDRTERERVGEKNGMEKRQTDKTAPNLKKGSREKTRRKRVVYTSHATKSNKNWSARRSIDRANGKRQKERDRGVAGGVNRWRPGWKSQVTANLVGKTSQAME